MLGFNKLLLVASVAVAGSAEARTYEYRLRGFGYGRNQESCDSDLARVARDFAVDADVEVLGAGCLPDDISLGGGLDGIITYAGTTVAKVFSSDVKSIGGEDGHYLSIDECRTALVQEESIFVAMTGLTPFVRYCYKANSVGQPRYRARLDAIGEPNHSKWSSDTQWVGAPASPDEVVLKVTSLAQDLGLVVSAASIAPDIGGWGMTLDYYGAKEHWLHVIEGVRWNSQESCREQSERLIANWPTTGPKIVATCDNLQNRTFGLLLFSLDRSIIDGAEIRVKLLPTVFASTAACEGERAIVEAAMLRAGTPAYATLCGQEAVGGRADVVRMQIFSAGFGIPDDDGDDA